MMKTWRSQSRYANLPTNLLTDVLSVFLKLKVGIRTRRKKSWQTTQLFSVCFILAPFHTWQQNKDESFSNCLSFSTGYSEKLVWNNFNFLKEFRKNHPDNFEFHGSDSWLLWRKISNCWYELFVAFLIWFNPVCRIHTCSVGSQNHR